MFHYLTTNQHNHFGRELDRVFDELWSMPSPPGQARAWAPPTEIEEAGDHYLLSLEIPGVSKDALKIEVVNDQLWIKGDRRSEQRHDQKGSLYSERHYGRFERAFALPTHVDPGRIEAQYQDGILRVYVPKAETAKPRQIKIEDGSGFLQRLLGKGGDREKTIDKGSGDRVA